MMVVYNPKNDAWSNLCLSKEEEEPYAFGERLIIVDDRLFFVYVYNYYPMNNTIVAIFEMKIEDRLFIQITKFYLQT